jgi:hypothetical protein
MSKLVLSLLAVITLSGCVAPADEVELFDDEEEEADSVQQAVTGTKCSTMSTDATAALAAIDSVRTKMGMAAINCDNKIQHAAINHAKYQGLNNVMTHQEVAGKQGFTGVNFWDRMKYTGFAGSAMNEVISGGGGGTAVVNQFMNSVYHRVPFVSFQAKSYGFGNYISGATNKYGTIDFASGGSAPSPTTTVVWPSVNATGVPKSFSCNTESPNPCNAGQTVVGSPISLTGGSDLTITSTKIVKKGTATGLAHLVRTNSFSGYIPKTQVYLIPNAPFAAATSYTATVTGSLNGSAFTKTWSFTTAN